MQLETYNHECSSTLTNHEPITSGPFVERMKTDAYLLTLVSILGTDCNSVIVFRGYSVRFNADAFTLATSKGDSIVELAVIEDEKILWRDKNKFRPRSVDFSSKIPEHYPSNAQFEAAMELAKLKPAIPEGIHFFGRETTNTPA